MSDLTKELPVVALRGMTILPSMIVHFDISREKSMTAVEQAMLDKQELFVVTQKDPEAAKPGQSDLYRVGTPFSSTISSISGMENTSLSDLLSFLYHSFALSAIFSCMARKRVVTLWERVQGFKNS